MTAGPLLGSAALDHVEIFVPDRAAAAGWYRRVFGLEPVDAWTHWATPRGPLMVAVPGASSMLAIFERPPCPRQADAEHHRVAFRVSGAALTEFAERGLEGPVYGEDGAPLSNLPIRSHGGAYSVYFCDPWGNRCEVTTYDEAPVAGYLAERAARMPDGT